LVVLGDAQVSLGGAVRDVVEDFHEDNGRCADSPRMVAKGFTQRVAAYFVGNADSVGGFADYAVGMYAGYRFACVYV